MKKGVLYLLHRIKDDRMEKYGAYFCLFLLNVVYAPKGSAFVIVKSTVHIYCNYFNKKIE